MNSRRSLAAGETVVIASHNPGKVLELRSCFPGFKLLSASDLGLSDPTEEGADFCSIASQKALFAAHASGLPAIADDCGLCILGLGNEPGILTKRHAVSCGGWAAGMRNLWERLVRTGRGTEATFHCALAIAFPDGYHHSVEGIVQGEMVWPPRGSEGAGYDPIFQPAGWQLTFAEMSDDERLRNNHRSVACGLLYRSGLLGMQNSMF